MILLSSFTLCLDSPGRGMRRQRGQ